MEVRDLFFNVPARRKFLRAYQTELSHIRECFITQALAHPDIGMSLKVDGRVSYQLAAGASLADRLRELFGGDYLKQLRELSFEGADTCVTGFVSGPGFHRADRHEQYCFVNGRATSAPVLNFAIREGFRLLIPDGRQPCVFLFLTMPPDLVDVNVHPTKKEVRFRRASEVRDSVIGGIKAVFQGQLVSDSEAVTSDIPEYVSADRPAVERQMDITDLSPTHTFRYPRATGSEAQPALGGTRVFGSGSSADGVQAEEAPAADETLETAAATAPWAWCRVLGQLAGQYVVLETEEGMVLMDPRAAHERVLYEQLLRQADAGDMHIQPLLMPETIELTPKDTAVIRKHLDVLKAMGFGVSEFGGNSFLVDAVPSCLKGTSVQEILLAAPGVLEQAGGRRAQGRWKEEAVAEAASRAAVSGRKRFTLHEIEQLVIDLSRSEMPYTNPRGRPTLIFMSVQELNRKFGKS
jgi:DNA mismatch repair protein MutL